MALGLLACAVLTSACQPDENIPEAAPAATEATTTLAINPPVLEADPTTTTEPPPSTTTTEAPAPPTTTVYVVPEPILCGRLPHPEHHSPCPTATTREQATTSVAPARSSSGTLASIRACESGGDYTTDTGNGYYGAYQFHPGTWESVGGSGNPAHASPAEQDMRAQMMIDAGRRGEWPNC